MEKKRVDWIDIAKFLGMFAIYLGHFGAVAGKGYLFVFQFHVPLFFLLSGCTETFNSEQRMVPYIVKKVKGILIPAGFFAIVSIIIQAIMTDFDLTSVKAMLLLVAKGLIRNSFFVDSLWFLTCLFVIEIVFMLLQRLRIKWLILGICFGMFVIAETVMDPKPISVPSWIYNIDSAFYYIIFYAIGFFAFPLLKKLFEMETRKSKAFIAVSGTIALLYSILLFAGKDILMYLNTIPVIELVLPIVRALLVIYLCFVVSKMCENVNVFKELGKNTLYLCGSEWIVKTGVTSLAQLFGLTVNIATPLSVYLYVTILLLVANRYLVPVEKRILSKVK